MQADALLVEKLFGVDAAVLLFFLLLAAVVAVGFGYVCAVILAARCDERYAALHGERCPPHDYATVAWQWNGATRYSYQVCTRCDNCRYIESGERD